MSNASKDLLIACSMSFISNLAAKANSICATHNKKTIIAEHVFQAMHEAKQTFVLAPILEQPNYAKLSYVKQKDIALKKVNDAESKKVDKFPQHPANNLTAEQLAAEQEKIFEQARNFELQKQISFQPAQMEVAPTIAPTPLEHLRDVIIATDFEAMSDCTEHGFTFDD